jgi:hypothetical protein
MREASAASACQSGSQQQGASGSCPIADAMANARRIRQRGAHSAQVRSESIPCSAPGTVTRLESLPGFASARLANENRKYIAVAVPGSGTAHWAANGQLDVETELIRVSFEGWSVQVLDLALKFIRRDL